MTDKKRQPESDDRDAGNAAKQDSTFDKFKRLARGVVKVSKEELDEEQRRYSVARKNKQK